MKSDALKEIARECRETLEQFHYLHEPYAKWEIDNIILAALETAALAEKTDTASALKVVLDCVDYMAGNCKVNSMVAAVLDASVIKMAREALASTSQDSGKQEDTTALGLKEPASAVTVETQNTLAVASILEERERQELKWGEQNHDPFTYLTVLIEEVGEFAQAALHHRFGGPEAFGVRNEAVQVAAVALAIIECIDRAKWAWPLHEGEKAPRADSLNWNQTPSAGPTSPQGAALISEEVSESAASETKKEAAKILGEKEA